MTKTLKETLKEIQILLGKPIKIAGVLKYYLGFLNIKENGQKPPASHHKREEMNSIRHGKITWVDVINPNRRIISELAQKFPFHPLHLEDCLTKGQFPKIEHSEDDEYLFLLFRFPRYISRDENIVISQICFFLGKNYLISVHEDPKDAISEIFNECKENTIQRKVYINNSTPRLLYTITNRLTENLSQLQTAILQEVDETEDVVFDDKVSGAYNIGQLRRKILNSRRVVGPLRALMEEMKTSVNKFSRDDLSIYIDNIADALDKTWETLEEAKDTVDIYKDADFIISSEKTNRILAVLTIIFTLSIPATVIGTFYGMNIWLPGGIEAGHWTFFGPFSTFIVILTSAFVPALLMHLYFKKRGWV